MSANYPKKPERRQPIKLGETNRAQVTGRSFQLTPQERKKPQEPEPNWKVIVAIVGFIASIFGICAYLTGVQSLPDWISGMPVRTPRPTLTPAPTVFVLPTMTFLPLIKGSSIVSLDSSNHFNVGFSFKAGRIATGTDSVDLQISNCLMGLADLTLFCDIKAKNITLHENKMLNDLRSVPYYNWEQLTRSPIVIGNSYTLLTFDGHPAKFQITNITPPYGNNSFLSFVLLIDFVYDQNESEDGIFRGN